MKNKIIIKEQNVIGAGQFTDEGLKNAFSLGCWPSTVKSPVKDPISGNQAIYRKSVKPENSKNPHVFDFAPKPGEKFGVREFRTTADATGKVAKSSKWYCEKLVETKNPVLEPDQETALKTLETFSKGQVVRWAEGVNKSAEEGWDLMNLSDALEYLGPNYATYINNTIKTNLVVPKVWVLKGAKQFNPNLSNPVVQKFLSDGWLTKEQVIEKNGNSIGFETIDLSNCNKNPDTCKDFQGGYILYRDSGITADVDVIKKLEEAVKNSKSGEEKVRKIACKNAIEFYKRAYEIKLEISQPKIDSLKPAIRNCLNNFPKFSKIAETLQFASPVQTQTGKNADYSLNVNAGQSVQRESKEKQLKNLVRESLLEIKEKKIKSNLSEGKIVKGRLSIISENVVLKTNKQKDKFCNELLSEMIYLNSQGFNKQVINEGFFDVLKGLFGHAPEGIMEYFKEYIGKWLVEHLTPVDPEGWVGNIIITSIGNLAIADIPKLTDCNFLTKLISKSVGEGAVRKLSHEKGLDGPFYDVLRNSIVDMLDTTSLVTKIEEGLGNVICPLLGGVKNKMDAATDKLKEKALAK